MMAQFGRLAVELRCIYCMSISLNVIGQTGIWDTAMSIAGALTACS
jgi:hypothetical protein